MGKGPRGKNGRTIRQNVGGGLNFFCVCIFPRTERGAIFLKTHTTEVGPLRLGYPPPRF